MAKATLLLEDRSAALSEIIDVTLKWSRNGYAETLLRSIAPAGARYCRGRSHDLARDASQVGHPSRKLPRPRRIGLSRYDYLTSDAAVWLLTYVWLDPGLAENFRTALPVFGVNGTWPTG